LRSRKVRVASTFPSGGQLLINAGAEKMKRLWLPKRRPNRGPMEFSRFELDSEPGCLPMR
jgi:hypothetical protein